MPEREEPEHRTSRRLRPQRLCTSRVRPLLRIAATSDRAGRIDETRPGHDEDVIRECSRALDAGPVDQGVGRDRDGDRRYEDECLCVSAFAEPADEHDADPDEQHAPHLCERRVVAEDGDR